MFFNNVLLIRPCNFGFNRETSATNIFQKRVSLSQKQIQKRALNEFENFVKILNNNKVTTEIFDDTPLPHTPDSIFPNNWFSSHENGLLIIYPMLAVNRRTEKRKDIIEFLEKKYSFDKLIDLSRYEDDNKFLEGTGSLVFDHKNKIAYANISSRTNIHVTKYACKLLNYVPVLFHASDTNKNEIYHTNVMLSIGNGFAIICLDSIIKNDERKKVKFLLEKSGLEIVEISFEQMNCFCGNTLQLQNSTGEKVLVMSSCAYKTFNKKQILILEKFTGIIHSPLDTIETIGGGSAQCMMAEIFSAE